MGTPGRPDDRLRETHHLQLCSARAVTNYRRNFICGGSFFFTANLAERRLRRLVDDIDLLRQAFRYVRRRHAFDIEAIVVLPTIGMRSGRCRKATLILRCGGGGLPHWLTNPPYRPRRDKTGRIGRK
jgi:hypothetical protein